MNLGQLAFIYEIEKQSWRILNQDQWNLNESVENLLEIITNNILLENDGIKDKQAERKRTPHGRETTTGKFIESLEGKK